MRRTLMVVMTIFLVVVGTGTTAIADPVVTGEDDNVKVNDSEQTSDQTTSGSDAVYTVPKPYKTYKYVLNCSINDLDNPFDVNCGAASFTCPGEGELRYRRFSQQHAADGSVVPPGADYEADGSVCRGPDDPPEGGPIQITIADIRDEAIKAAPASVVHVEPGNRSFVNVPTNFYADTAAQDVSVQVLGQTIGLRFEPSGYTWTYGDGSTGSGAGVENAPVGGPGAVEHAYLRSGGVSITLARTFTVTFTLPGGQAGTLPAPGISNTSEPYPLEIGEIQSVVTEVR